MLLTVSEAAEKLSYSKSRLYELIDLGLIPKVQRQKGCAIRIKIEDVEKYIANNYTGIKEG
ncbi:MAG: helix-turn-helix domain-containing protein [Aminipila sp.]